MKKDICEEICNSIQYRTYIATAKVDGKPRQKEFEMTYINVSVLSSNLNRIIQETVYFSVYEELEKIL